MAAIIEASLGNIMMMTASSSSASEVLVLPSSYVHRRLKHFTPKSSTTTKPCSPSPSSSSSSSSSAAAASSQSQQQQQKNVLPTSTSNNNDAISVPTTTTTVVAAAPVFRSRFQDDTSSCITLKENEILFSPQTSRLSIIYSLPGFGSTSLMISLIVQIQEFYSDRWVSYMDLRRVATFMQRQSSLNDEKADERNWSLPKLISSYNKITLPSAVQQIDEFFKQSDDAHQSPILAELFLDELDEVTPKMQEVLLKIIARDVPWKNCQTRVWISSRHHIKPRIEKLLHAQVNSYELLPFTRDEQINLMAHYWKLTSCPNVADSKLKNFASGLHDHMEKLISNFYKTIGACPSHLLQIPDFFTHIVTKLEEDMKDDQISFLDISVTKLFEKFTKTKYEGYIDKVSCEQPILAMSSLQFREKEFRKLEKIHVRAAVSSYPNFECEPKIVFAGNAHQQDQAHELYRVGICYEDNGKLRFVHQMYAEFLLAQYYVDSGRQKNTSNMCISFFLNNVLFDAESKTIRKFFDSYLKLQQQERQKIRSAIVWNRLRCFLIKHYRLNEEACLTSSEEEGDDGNNTDAAQDQEQSQKLTYEDIKHNGSISNLVIMEGLFNILQMLIDCFKGFPDELRKFLSIKVPLEIFSENPFAKADPKNPEVHLVDPFQMLAFYGYGTEYMEKVITLWFHYFGDVHMAQYFEDGTWTVIHYAAMNSNCNFLHALFSKGRKWEKVEVNQRNPDGQQPIHMILTKCWYYSIKIKDHPHPDFKYCTLAGMPQAASSSASMRMIAIQDAIDAALSVNSVTIKEEPEDPDESPSTSDFIPLSSTSDFIPISSTSAAETGRKRKQKGAAASRKKGKNAGQQKQLTRRRSSTQVIKVFKDIWCFEGVDKDFVAAWDVYPEEVEWNPLQSHLTCLTLLMENGGDVNAPDDVNGKTVLHQAATLESVKLACFLLQHGADVNIQDDFKRTPAQYAALQGNVHVLETLAGQSTKSSQQDGDGFVKKLSELLKSGKHSSIICRIS